MDERVKKCKQGFRFGQDHGRAKLTDHEVELIRQLYDGGMTQSELVDKFEIAKSHVSRLVNYKQR